MMMKTRMRINDVYSVEEILSTISSIFTFLSNNETYPNVHDFINDNNLSVLTNDYYLSHSNEKYLSNFALKIYDRYKNDTDNPVGYYISSYTAEIVYSRFSEKWKRIYDALMTQYSPLENYNMEEERNNDKEYSDSGATNTNLSVQRETSATSSYHGFNSSDYTPVSKTDGDENTSTTGSDETNTTSKSGSESEDETTSRHGNIGVTTSQQMLESELKVRQYDFYKQVFNDIDLILCLSIY